MVKPGDTVYFPAFDRSASVVSPQQMAEMVDGCEVKTIRHCSAYLDYAILPGGVLVLVDMGKDSKPPTPPTMSGQESPQDGRKPTEG